MDDSTAICPTIEYRDLKKDPQHFVEVIADIKGLEKKLFGRSSNADIELDMTERSLLLNVCLNPLKGTGKISKYRYEVKRLPADIDPKRSSYEVKTGRIIIHLRKVVAGSWAAQLSSVGLEHFTET